MNFDTTRSVGPAGASGAPRTPSARGAHAGEFARVVELADVRRRKMTGPDRIPEEVWEDIHRAGELCDALRASGRQIRFDTHHLTGRVVASLCDAEGNVLRPFALRDVVGLDPEPTPAA